MWLPSVGSFWDLQTREATRYQFPHQRSDDLQGLLQDFDNCQAFLKRIAFSDAYKDSAAGEGYRVVMLQDVVNIDSISIHGIVSTA